MRTVRRLEPDESSGALPAASDRRHKLNASGRGMTVEQGWFVAGSVLMLLAVLSGAFATHGLKPHISADALDWWQTGARYHAYHALALFAVAYASAHWNGGLSAVAGWLFVAGIILFSGSLYLMAVSGAKWLGAITPLGGLCFIAGWVSLALAVFKG